ncbi:fasciclin-like arabinogalactan protein 12 [Humulus lupulus]|uniref:fasciclin-like arabinogalactan protein 12 n=1 Tax=Humulus lupulus TaxID=3486 RepID=UPI002B405B95|nr:fasciclin-like arabinogalactan protein 12 [Humulus lupulus]
MTKSQALISFSCLIVFLFYHCTATLAQSSSSSPAQAPFTSKNHPSSQSQAQSPEPLVQAPPAAKSRRRVQPTNVTEILDKAGGFSVFIRLLISTDVITPIENDLNVSNTVTILAPTNGGFSALKAGTLNTLSPQQKVQLVKYHVLPTFVALQNFQTLTNPVRTQASNTRDFPLNIITDGNSVNISTGVVNTTISGTVYSDNQLAIYRVDMVLLPIKIFAPKVSSPAPTPVVLKPNKQASSSSSSSSTATASSGSPSPSLKPSSTSTSSSPTTLDEPVATVDTSGVLKPTGTSGVLISVGLAAVALLL